MESLVNSRGNFGTLDVHTVVQVHVAAGARVPRAHGAGALTSATASRCWARARARKCRQQHQVRSARLRHECQVSLTSDLGCMLFEECFWVLAAQHLH